MDFFQTDFPFINHQNFGVASWLKASCFFLFKVIEPLMVTSGDPPRRPGLWGHQRNVGRASASFGQFLGSAPGEWPKSAVQRLAPQYFFPDIYIFFLCVFIYLYSMCFNICFIFVVYPCSCWLQGYKTWHPPKWFLCSFHHSLTHECNKSLIHWLFYFYWLICWFTDWYTIDTLVHAFMKFAWQCIAFHFIPVYSTSHARWCPIDS